jgi:hypothetical protein
MLETAQFSEGDRVRNTRTGALGRVHIFKIDPADAGEDVGQGEVKWDGLFAADELALVLPYLELHSD